MTNVPTMGRAIHEMLDEKALRRLLAELADEARARRFEVAPNPVVGAAVLAGSEVVARGFHEVWGEAHAEVRALEAASRTDVPSSEWTALAVTLEPCSTQGKTPPCTQAILQSGIPAVVVGSLDPDARHRGSGLELLRRAGLSVELFESATPIEQVSPNFVRWTSADHLRQPRPWTIAKWAQTRSGQLVPPAEVGGGRWISGRESQAEVQRLRGRVDAIVTGVQTVLRDDPRLSVRPPGDASRPPIRVVLDSYLRTPVDARLFQPPGPLEGAGEVHLLCQAGANAARHRALEAAGAKITGLHASELDHVQLRDVQQWLWERGVRRVLLECGPQLLGRYLEQGFVDQVRVYTGNVSGGQGESMANWLSSLRFEARLDRECGADSVLEAFVAAR
jgi:diaminohydroxyphosphoribosylaminopyrimidine deaminase/5-amino-6-(5-phosphoribosylamino)uracil reductase